MKISSQFLSLLVFAGILSLSACGAPKVYRDEFRLILPDNATISIGEIITDLENDNSEYPNVPSAERISYFKESLVKRISERNLFDSVAIDAPESDFIVKGKITLYKAGDSVVRFIFGPILGAAKVTVELEVTSRNDSAQIFIERYGAKIDDWFLNGQGMFDQVSREFGHSLTLALRKKAIE